MDRYMKLFVLMSLVYFFAGSLLGIGMATGMDTVAARFAHIHLNLLGFMAMMIFGVGYFILPRFNARTLRWPTLVAVHFWVANITLVSMVIFYTLAYGIFVASAVLQILSIALFAVHVAASVMEPEKAVSEERSTEAPASAEVPLITEEMKVAEIVARWPSATKVFVQHGLEAFSDPSHIENARKLGVTVAMVAKRHGLDARKLLGSLAAEVGGRLAAGSASAPSEDVLIGQDSIIGDVLKAYPRTEKVFRRFYGEGCFSCPGQAFETIKQSALMHNVNEKEVLEALNMEAKQQDAH